MRTRTNMSGLVVSATPTGKARTSKEERCHQGINKLQKLIDENYKISSAKKKEQPKPTHVITMVWDKKVKVTVEVFEKKYKPLGFKVIAEI